MADWSRHRGRIGLAARRVRRNCAEAFAVLGRQREPGAARQWPGRDLELDGFAATGGPRRGKFNHRGLLGGERAHQIPRTPTASAAINRYSRIYGQFVLTVIWATWGDIAIARNAW